MINLEWLKRPYLPHTNEVVGKVMFSRVRLSVCPLGGGVIYHMCDGISHIPYPSVLLISGGHHWRPVQTCSVEDLLPPPHWYWHLVVATEAGGTHPTGMLSCFHMHGNHISALFLWHLRGFNQNLPAILFKWTSGKLLKSTEYLCHVRNDCSSTQTCQTLGTTFVKRLECALICTRCEKLIF